MGLGVFQRSTEFVRTLRAYRGWYVTKGAKRESDAELRQYLQEFALMYRGLSIQQEYHWKRVEDRVMSVVTMLRYDPIETASGTML